MSVVREKSATLIDSELLGSVRKLARDEGRQIQAVVEEALWEHLDATRELRYEHLRQWLADNTGSVR
jgi:predicted transcriptional regulator